MTKPLQTKEVQKQINEKSKDNKAQYSGINAPVSYLLEENVRWLQSAFDKSSDFVVRKFVIGETAAAFFYLDALANKEMIQENVLKPLMYHCGVVDENNIEEKLLLVSEIQKTTMLNALCKGILDGDGVLLVDGLAEGWILGLKGWQARGIEDSRTEVVLRGPRESFTETLRTNTGMLRRRIKTNKLKLESRTIGTMTKSNIAIAYIEGIIQPEILDELHRRLDKIKEVDSILEGGCIEQYIEDRPFSLFPQIQYTERPDRVAAYLLEGRAAIIVDGTPDVLIVPTVFVQFLQSPEDYYNRFWAGSFVRWIRYFGLIMAVLLPSLYVAVTSYQPEMLPLNFVLSIAAAREGVALPAFMEALIMEVFLELLREASIRLPSSISNSLGIVGALVIGQAAVEANLVVPQVVIVVALTAIGSFTMPSFEISYPLRLVRFPLMIAAAIFGLYGVVVGVLVLIIHMVGLRSFGYPYLEPLAPFRPKELADVLVRPPRWQMMTKPLFRHATEDRPMHFWQRDYLKRGDKNEG